MRCFKAYDVRGRVPGELNEDLAYRMGRAMAQWLSARRCCVGHDIRLSSPGLAGALCRGLTDSGCDALRLGECGTEEVYFATAHLGLDGGIMVTASHNPADWNGMKLVREEARPISGDTGLFAIRDRTKAPGGPVAAQAGSIKDIECREAYIEHLLGYVDLAGLSPLKVLANPGNGCAGPVLRRLERRLPLEFSFIQEEPDGTFPNGVPNPLLPDGREATRRALLENGADLGLAWDGDFDRCFFFDETGRFIEGYYMVGLLAEAMLARHPGARIIHDPRLTWNTRERVRRAGGTPVQCKTGHAFIKERMRVEDAAYGGEMSAHHYFRDFSYCDSGMIPWLLVVGLMSVTGMRLSDLVDRAMRAYPVSGEINLALNPGAEVGGVLEAVRGHYADGVLWEDRTDGLGMEFKDWRFNLRTSNTEPVVRLNVEARTDRALMEKATGELLELLRQLGGEGAA